MKDFKEWCDTLGVIWNEGEKDNPLHIVLEGMYDLIIEGRE